MKIEDIVADIPLASDAVRWSTKNREIETNKLTVEAMKAITKAILNAIDVGKTFANVYVDNPYLFWNYDVSDAIRSSLTDKGYIVDIYDEDKTQVYIGAHWVVYEDKTKIDK